MAADLNKTLELEHTYKNEQLGSLNFKTFGKAPISTGQGVFYDTSILPYSYQEQFNSNKKLLETEIIKANWLRDNCVGRMASLRINMGNFIPSMFGTKFVIEENQGSGWNIPVDNSLEEIVERGVPSLNDGLFPKIRECAEYLAGNAPAD